MKTNYFLIAGGNSTLLIKNSPIDRQTIINNFLGKVEQIGFVSKNTSKFPKLEMMGNELCINGTLAFASTLKKTGYLYTSGINDAIWYKNTENKSEITVTLPYQKKKNIVLFEGIGFVLINNENQITLSYLKKLANFYNKPAFGAIVYRENTLIPYIFVRETNSLIKETACGSGSIALFLLLGVTKIKQPSGEYIFITESCGRFTVKAKVVKIGDRYE